jgi:hypothetical protein
VSRINRSYRALKFAGSAGKAIVAKGSARAASRAAAKANLPLAAVDAAISVLDGVRAYLGRRAAMAETARLKSEIEGARATLIAQREAMEAAAAAAEARAGGQQSLIELNSTLLGAVHQALQIAQARLAELEQTELDDLGRWRREHQNYERALSLYNKAARQAIGE